MRASDFGLNPSVDQVTAKRLQELGCLDVNGLLSESPSGLLWVTLHDPSVSELARAHDQHSLAPRRRGPTWASKATPDERTLRGQL